MSTPIYISDCHDAPVTNVNGEKGICSRCKQECWACDPEMLKPISLERLIESVKIKEQPTKQ